MAEKTTFKDRALRAVSVLGLIAILIIGAWGIIQIAFVLAGFLGNVGTDNHITTPVAPAPSQQVVVTTPPPTPAPTAPAPTPMPTPTPTPKPTTVAPAKTPASTYVAAKRTPTLYGLSDLSVSTGSVTQNSGRYSVQFTIQNTGTNVTPANWTFNASLPTSPTYNYTSDPQRALYPGDKIVYTLGFSMQNNTSYYPSTYGYQYGYQNLYPSNCAYTTNYTYNGQYNYPNVSYGCNAGYNYAGSYNTNYNYGNSYGYSNGVVTVTVDPQNYISESSEYNNTSSVSVGY